MRRLVLIILGLIAVAALMSMLSACFVDKEQKQLDEYCRGRFRLARTLADSQAVLREPHSNWTWTGSTCASYLGRQP